LGGFLFDTWTAGAPFYIMALLNLIALFTAIVIIVIDRTHPKTQLDDLEEEPLLHESDIS
jgi:hypothetical protein